MTTQSDSSTYCDDEWKRVFPAFGDSLGGRQQLLQKWLTFQERCRRTGIYEFRLASLYDSLGQHENARRLVDSTLSDSNTKYRHYLRSLQLSFRFQDLLRKKESDIVKYRELITAHKEIIKSNPEWPLSYELLANVQMFVGDRDEAIKNAEKAISLDDSLWPPRRVLVIAYTEKSEFEKARSNIVRAIELNDDLLGNADFMYAAAWTYTALAEYKTAEAVLNNLLQRNPGVREEDKFRKVFGFLQQEYQKSK